MDGSTNQQAPQVDVEAVLDLIKRKMPATYRAVHDRAGEVGRVAFRHVRRAIAGEPNLFWACERGHVVGTPFQRADITAEVAQQMVAFGPSFVVIWCQPEQPAEAAHGAN